MKLFAALLIMILLVFSGYHLTFRSMRLPLFARKLYLTGIEFLLLGVLLGPYFLNLLDVNTLRDLEPMSALLLGWIGLLFGFQFEVPKLRRYSFDYFLAGFLESAATFLVVFFGVYFAVSFISLFEDSSRIVMSCVSASIAACTSQTWLGLMAPAAIRRHHEAITLLRFISAVSSFAALLVFSAAFLFFPLVDGAPDSARLFSRAVIGLCVGIGGVIMWELMVSQRRSYAELVLIVIGMVVMVSGLATFHHFSPLVANFILGLAIVNISREKERVYKVLTSVEKPAYLLLLVLLGAGWAASPGFAVMLGAGFFCLRVLGKYVGGYVVTRFSRFRTYPAHLGFGLLDTGGLPLAILYDFRQGFVDTANSMLVGIILFAIVLNDIVSPHFLSRIIERESK